MQRRRFLQCSLFAPMGLGVARQAFADTSSGLATAVANRATADGKPHRFGFAQRGFVLDDRPFQLRCGQMDPIRIPRGHWRHRIRMARAMGLNAIAIYVMWNAVEPEPGQFDFHSDRRAVGEFIDLCAEQGMWVYLRPGPYVCAEWDFGGLPAWLLRHADMRVRHADDVRYMQAVGAYFDALAAVVRPRMCEHGGPVLMVQVENEYASFGDDTDYLRTLARMWRERGIDGPFALSDGLLQITRQRTYLVGSALGLDGGTDFVAAQAIAGDAPVWVGEGYTGWLSHWGDDGFQHSDYASTLRQLMDAGRSFNLYEVHGGTSFGFGAGANSHGDGSEFKADITSYDYGAPIDEQGRATDEYHRLRAIIGAVTKQTLPTVPATPPTFAFEPVVPSAVATLWDDLPAPRTVDTPRPNELLNGQTRGLVLYRKRLRPGAASRLTLEGVRDYAVVFVDGRRVGTVSRVRADGVASDTALTLPPGHGATVQLDILVDSFGHVGYGPNITDRKGLLGPVTLDGKPLRDWQFFGLPLAAEAMRAPESRGVVTPRAGTFFRHHLDIEHPADCFIDMSAWHKGHVWVNGHLLGRYWHVGPQQRLYGPAEWWREGRNTLLILDLERDAPARVCGWASSGRGEAAA